MNDWKDIESAPKDGSKILVLSAEYEDSVFGKKRTVPAREFTVWWQPEGTSWVDKQGELGKGCYTLAVTGVWFCTEGGWFQPNEVTHWKALENK